MTRKEAIVKGLKLYASGKKCRKHPESPRRASNGNCHECICERMKTPHSRRLLKKRRAQKKAPGAISTRGKSIVRGGRQTRGGADANG